MMVQQDRMSLAHLAEQISEVEFDNCAMWTDKKMWRDFTNAGNTVRIPSIYDSSDR